MNKLLFHGTDGKGLSGALKEGLRNPGPEWLTTTLRKLWTEEDYRYVYLAGSLELARYYAQVTAQLNGSNKAFVVAIPLARFDVEKIYHDIGSVEDPIEGVFEERGLDLGLIKKEWESSGKTWRDCLRLYDGILYRGRTVAVYKEDIVDSCEIEEELYYKNKGFLYWEPQSVRWENNRQLIELAS